MNTRFYYLDYGSQATIAVELHYSLATLRAEGVEPSQITIATDRPELYHGTDYGIIDLRTKLKAYLGDTGYQHRVKPSLILDMLRTNQENIVLLDTDTYFKPGFLKEVQSALEQGMGMNFFIRRDPYPGFGPFETMLPSGQHYHYDQTNSVMYNSGLLAIRPDQDFIVADAIGLIDALWSGPLKKFDIEQFALTEAFRIHKVTITPVSQTVHHYHSRWTRRYMHWRLNLGAPISFSAPKVRRPNITVNKALVRLYRAKYFIENLFRGNVRTALRDLKILPKILDK